MSDARSIRFTCGHVAAAAVVVLALSVLSAPLSASTPAALDTTNSEESASASDVAVGRALFLYEWLPDDPRSHGGDGLGPVYNESSCVACHNQGGVGGAGPANKNVEILSSIANAEVLINSGYMGGQLTPLRDRLAEHHAGFAKAPSVVVHRFGTDPNYAAWRRNLLASTQLVDPVMPVAPGLFPSQLDPSVNFHETGGVVMPVAPGIFPSQQVPQIDFNARVNVESFVAAQPSNTLVLADVPAEIKGNGIPVFVEGLPEPQNFTIQAVGQPMTFGNADRLQIRSEVLSRRLARSQVVIDGALLARTQRNTTALYGAGLIDDLPEEVLIAAANARDERFPEVSGRASRLADGRIGRFGWKAQTASLEDFVLTACAVELGLEVPDHDQALIPQAPLYRPEGLDLTAEECDTLVAFVRDIDRPIQQVPGSSASLAVLEAGRLTFERIGCASCHTPDLGDVGGIFSDLSLHDMGADSGDSGSYSIDTPLPSEDPDEVLTPPQMVAGADHNSQAPRAAPATSREWRTPPLWGFRDSAPYLHDGVAETLEEAVAVHGGEGNASAERFFELTPRERMEVEVFLKSQVAPTMSGR